jgi:hypothetical protein
MERAILSSELPDDPVAAAADRAAKRDAIHLAVFFGLAAILVLRSFHPLPVTAAVGSALLGFGVAALGRRAASALGSPPEADWRFLQRLCGLAAVTLALTAFELGAFEGRKSRPGVLLLLVVLGLSVDFVRRVPPLRAGHARLAPKRRVRFEIGGLGTREEDVTPREHRGLLLGEALAAIGAGAGIVAFVAGWLSAAIALGCLAIFLPPLAAFAARWGALLAFTVPWLAALLYPLAADLAPSPAPALLALLAALLALESQQTATAIVATPRRVQLVQLLLLPAAALGAGGLANWLGVLR